MANVKATDLIDFTRASKGHALAKVSYGDDLVTNGTFDSDTSNWGSHSGAVLSAVNGRLRVAGQSGDSAYAAKQDLIVEVGKLYQIKADVFGPAATSFRIGSTERGTEYGNIIDSAVFINVVATTTLLSLTAYGLTADSYAEYDNISVKEVLFDQPNGTLQLFEHPEGIPRIEYDADGNLLGLLIEESRTNLVESSEDITDAWWSYALNVTRTADQAVSPDGRETADKVVATSTNSTHSVGTARSYSSGAAVETFSFYAKPSGINNIQVILANQTGNYSQVFNLSEGTLGTIGSGNISQSIQDVGNGWYRCSMGYTSTKTNPYPTIRLLDDSFNSTFAGNDTDGILLWGAQVEEGSFPTSYIKSNSGSTTTRSADVASIPVSDFGYNQSEGSMVVEATCLGDVIGSLYAFSDGTSDNRIRIYGLSNNNVYFIVGDNNVNQAVIDSKFDSSAGTSFKIASFYKQNDMGVLYDGGSALVDTSGTIPDNISQLGIGTGEALTGYLNGHIKSIKYIPKRLSNAKLQELTS